MSKRNLAAKSKLNICMFGDGDIMAFGGLTQISIPNFYAERVRRRQKAEIVEGFLMALFDPILESTKI